MIHGQKHAAAVSIGALGRTHAFAVLSASQTSAGPVHPVTFETPEKKVWTVIRLERWAARTSVDRLAFEIVRLRQLGYALNDPHRWTGILVDANAGAEAMRQFRRAMEAAEIHVRQVMVGSDVTRDDLMRKLASLTERGELKILSSLPLVEEWRAQIANVDEGLWRANSSDDLVSAVALAALRANERPMGWMTEPLVAGGRVV